LSKLEKQPVEDLTALIQWAISQDPNGELGETEIRLQVAKEARDILAKVSLEQGRPEIAEISMEFFSGEIEKFERILHEAGQTQHLALAVMREHRRLFKDYDSDRRRIRRCIFDRLPLEIPMRTRLRRASQVAYIAATTIIVVRDGLNERTLNASERQRTEMRNRFAANVVAGADVFVKYARNLDLLSPHRPVFSNILEEKAKALGIHAPGNLGELMLAAIADTSDSLREPVPIPPLIARRVQSSESLFDGVIWIFLSDLLSRKACARLLVQLREELGIAPATPETIEQRLRNVQHQPSGGVRRYGTKRDG
jgi:hypothetical protein